MMQGIHHHHHQQLAALLTAALPKDDSVKKSSTSPAAASASSPSEEDESSRLGAITSLHRAILYPPNSLLVTHSASFLAQGFSQLLTDKSYSVRHEAATAYGALCSVLCSISISSNGRQNHVLLVSLIDRFIGWSLPYLRNNDNQTSELALESLREFLNVGEVGAVERYALPILKACQELLEDDRTSMNFLPRLLGVLTLISLKFFRCFQPHFVDIVDLLLGWAMVPDISESDKRVIMDSFLQFQKHWVNNLQFSLGLLSKFLDDMDMLLQDGSPGTPQQFKRLLALLSCFCTVLQSVASGLLEINYLEQISEPLSQMVPVLLRCLSMVGTKFGWSKWIEDSWRCLTLLAEILGDKFSTFYSIAVDILFQSLVAVGNINQLSAFKIHGVLKTNLQLLSLQKLGLMTSSVDKILQFDGPVSQLRLHPNYLVTGSAAATYIFLLQHGKNDIAEKTMDSLIEEILLLKRKLEKNSGKGDELEMLVASKFFSVSELAVLIKFNLKVLLSCVALPGAGSLIWQAEIDSLYLHRVEKLVTFITDWLDPFSLPIMSSVDLQVTLIRTLERLSSIEFTRKCSIRKQNIKKSSPETSYGKHVEEETLRDIYPSIVFGHLKKYSVFLVRALDISSPIAVKIEALKWMRKFCEGVLNIYANIHNPIYPCQAVECCKTIQDLLFSTLAAASDREPNVRSLVATVLDALLRAKIIHPMRFPIIAETILEKLGDPEKDIKNLYLKLLSHVLPLTIYVCGLSDSGATITWQPRFRASAGCTLHWKQVFALQQLAQQLHSQQLVSVLNYISQRWKVPLSSWIQRLILSCRRKNDHTLIQPEEAEITDHNRLWLDIKVEEDFVESVCSVNLLAGAWWAIHEAARFCITTRLRTNLGGPTQTFSALERMLRDIAHILQLETEQNDGNSSIIGSHAHLLPMRLLLEFVESLKKSVYNAYEGSTVLVHAPRSSSLFFRANKKVCEEWFSRINEPMMDAGMALQCHDATVHYCALRLQDFSYYVSSALTDNKPRAQISENIQNLKGRYGGDILRIARNMSLALCKKQEPEALAGLQKWLTMAFSPLFSEENQVPNSRQFSWIIGLVYQARGHHEKAAAHFIHLLQDEESLASMGSDGIQFIIARIIESYTAISDWKSLETWLTELQTIRGKYAGKSYAGALTTAGNEMNAIQALACFDADDFQSAWSYLDLTPKSSSELTLDPRLALQRSEQMLLQAMLLHVEGKVEKVPDELQKAKSMLEDAFSVLPLDGLVEAAPHINLLYRITAFEECFKLGDGQAKSFQSLLGTYIQNTQFPCNRVHQDCSSWLKVMRVCQRTHPTSPTTLELCRNLMILARKQRNLLLATRLNNYLKSHASLCLDEKFCDNFVPNLEYENILLTRVNNDYEGALTNLWSFLRPSMVSSSNVASCSQNNVLMAKACLKLSNWLPKDFSGENLAGVVLKMQADFNIIEISDDEGSKSRVSHIIEELVGTSRKLSTRLCPIMGKTWILYASWCYTQARASISSDNEVALRSCSFSPILATEIQPERFVLSKEEKLLVKEIVLKLIPERSEELLEETSEFMPNDLKHLLRQIIDIIETAAGAPSAEDCSSNSLSTAVFSQLQKCLLFSSTTLDEAKLMPVLGDLVDVWWVLRKRRISLFGHAAQAFINYLSYSSLKCFGGQLTGLDVDPKYKCVNYTLRAMLFVLKILVNYGVELKDTLEAALSKVPMLPWQEITPQLFAQLSSHPEKVVRKQLETLLVMLGKLSPWSLVYPTLVDANSQEKEPSEELQKILAYLNKLYPRLIQDAQLMIKELENVTVLWEELWLGTLQDLHADVMRRINLLKEEAARIAANKTLNHGEKNKINAAKYSAMMAPIVVVLERRLASTSRKPETPHEAWFLEEYLTHIKSAVTKFKTPPASVTVLGDVWRPFETIAASLASYQRKSSISVSEVAPQLASLLSSDAPIPGLEKQITVSESESSLNQEIITIASFSEEFVILPTKTKPKKLVIVGSDGLKYTYLLKGREDLRLDARIMQLLQAVNGFLQSSSATHGQSLGIRYYSVTPISGRAGLIQWVDNVISIYSVFKSWQNRVKLSEISALGADGNGVVPVPRPSDMFYGKIIPALKEKGIRRVISRRDWPHDVKRKVLLDLMKETPKQLLQQELWCASEGFKAYSSKSKRYAGSVAAMSIVGHILGLGDRHLDNILIDFFSGDIVHIDYNVCFDKGQRLKIPEIVPFRLTQTIESALGLTGVEGTFRANCEAVSGVLRKNKDIILMLLEVFVWDPLVEWTRANFHDDAAVVGEERKGMELAVSLSLFASRVQEIRVPLQEHHDLLVSTVPAVESAIERFSSILNQYETVPSHFFRADQERSTLVLQETSAKSILAEATTYSEKSRLLFEMQAREFAQSQAMVMEKGHEAAGWIDQHGRVLDALRNSSIPEIKVSIKLNGSEEALSLTSAVSGAGVPLTVVPEPTQIQCHEIDREVSHLVTDLDHGLSAAVGALQMYSLALQRVLPLNYITTSPVYSWAQVLLSLNTLSPDLMLAARRQGADLVNKGHIDGIKDMYDGLCLKATKYAADIERLEEEHAELVASIGPGTESKAKERVLSAFKNYIQKDSLVNHEIERNKASVLSILDTAVSNLFSDVKHRLQKSLDLVVGERNANSGFQSDLESFSSELEEHIEKCLLVTEFANELKHDAGLYIREFEADANSSTFSIFKACLQLSKSLVGKMTEVVLPSAIKSILSFNSNVTDIFESISHIRGSVNTALEQLIQVELERISLIELESNYFVKVGRITEQQLALEEASVSGRDNLSWEEAEELASQEEACRVQLDQLHQTWNQKDLQISSLMEKEASISTTLATSELQLQSLITAEEETESHVFRGKALLLALLEPFSEFELVDRELGSFAVPDSYSSSRILYFADLINSGCSVSEYIWNFPGLVRRHAFFIWKVSMVDLLLASCTHDVMSSLDQKMGCDQLVDVIKRRVRNQIQDHVIKYLRDRIAPIFLTTLDREINKDIATSQLNTDFEAVRRVQLMLEECSNAHETFKAARSAASIMKRQINELRDAFVETGLEIAQMEWMYNITSIPFERSRLNFRKYFPNDDNFLPVTLNINRQKLVDAMQSSVAKVARSLEGLKSCEGTFAKAEVQLERAMSWACGGPGSARNSGIPSEFHDHLIKRRQILQEAQKNASDIMKVCISILEFEASRDGVFRSTGEISASRLGADGGMWQQNYLHALTKLDVAYHSFTRAEQEWKLAQSNMEVASNGLVSATNELHIASVKAKSTSGDLQSTLIAMRDSAYEASVALSAYGGIIRGHSALTSECGSMLEEVLAITEGLADVHSLGKEAATLHFSLMEYLSKANAVLIPLDDMLSKDVAAMTDAMSREKEVNLEIAPIHGQAIFQSYHNRVDETLQVFKPLVPSLTSSVKGLYSMLITLARAASLHAGNLHKALEGLGESLQVESQEVDPLRENLSGPAAAEYISQESGEFERSDGENDGNVVSIGLNEVGLSDRGWVSPPDSIYSGSSDSGVTSSEANIADDSCVNNLDTNLPTSGGSDSQDNGDSKNEQENSDSGHKGEASLLNQEKLEDESGKKTFAKIETSSQALGGKNAHAVSILRRVEMKIDGRDITDNREISIAEQVDFLLRQATNIDNLCNMYEGWTPWI